MGTVKVGLVSPDGVAPSRMVGVSVSVNLPLHHKVQKFSSGTGSPGWCRKKARKTVVVVWYPPDSPHSSDDVYWRTGAWNVAVNYYVGVCIAIKVFISVSGVSELVYRQQLLSMRSPVMDEERMRPGQRLGFLLSVPFIALTLMAGWQQGHLSSGKPLP